MLQNGNCVAGVKRRRCFSLFSTIAPSPASTGLLLIITLYLLIARVNPFRNKIPATLAESG
jgi:hypothetical protein